VELGLSPEKSAELRAFKSMVLRRIFARKREEVTGSWRKWYNEEHHNL
jgi:hypothetical protein